MRTHEFVQSNECEGLKAAVELLDCAMGVPCRPDLDDKIRAAIAKATT